MWVTIISILSIVVLVSAAIVTGFSIMNHQYDPKLEMLETENEDSLKALVIYQPSITSASSDVAHAIAEGLNDSGYQVTLNTPGDHLSSDISEYSLVVFGSPNYGGSPAQALLSYLSRIEDFSETNIFLFSTSGSADGRLEFDKIEALLQGILPIQTIKLQASNRENIDELAYQFGVDAGNIQP